MTPSAVQHFGGGRIVCVGNHGFGSPSVGCDLTMVWVGKVLKRQRQSPALSLGGRDWECWECWGVQPCALGETGGSLVLSIWNLMGKRGDTPSSGLFCTGAWLNTDGLVLPVV